MHVLAAMLPTISLPKTPSPSQLSRARAATPLMAALAGIVLFSLLADNPADARILQTKCDTLATSPPTVRFTFAVFNDCDVTIGGILFLKDPACLSGNDSCCVIECSGPQGWFCRADPAHQGGGWWTAPVSSTIAPGQRVEEFSLVTQMHPCCFSLYYLDPEPVADPVCAERVCFSLDQAVPTRVESWGEIKAIYR